MADVDVNSRAMQHAAPADIENLSNQATGTSCGRNLCPVYASSVLTWLRTRGYQCSMLCALCPVRRLDEAVPGEPPSFLLEESVPGITPTYTWHSKQVGFFFLHGQPKEFLM